ncbi:MAG: hypothetical protein H6744_11610 [Deltaproteobacteria bacterium]|nr:hypothetical protein [Deltaproteobacteria bacterium]MCB9787323.1 hypothetical protein [Deltaproteobacteria bacterium]
MNVRAARTVLLSLAVLAMAAPTARSAQSAWGTTLRFWGFAPDGSSAAWSRYETQRPRAGQEVHTLEQHEHRRIVDGSFGAPMPGPDPRNPDGWARSHGFRRDALERTTVKDHTHWFTAPEGIYEIAIDVGKRLVWELRFDGKAIVRQAFDQLYVQMLPTVYPSPDRRYLVVVMETDTGWSVNADLVLVPLPASIRERFLEANRALGEAVRRDAPPQPGKSDPAPDEP